MPNWCENKLTIKGKAENIIKFLDTVKEDYRDGETLEFSFNKIIPEPKTKEECPKEFLLETKEDREKAHLADEGDRNWFNWYSFHLAKWGTKWNACEVRMEPDIEEIRDAGLEQVDIYYDTAWSPAEEIMRYLLEHEDDYGLKFAFMFFEPGMCFLGELSDENDYCNDYSCDYDEETDEETYGDDATKEFFARYYNEED